VSPREPTRLPAATVHQIRKLAANAMSIELIAREAGVSRYRVEQVLDTAPAGRNNVPYRYRALPAEVARRYQAGESAEEIARSDDISLTAVYDYLRRTGIALHGKTAPHPPTFEHVLTDAYLRAEYIAAGRSAAELAAEVGCSESTVHNWLRRRSIPRRPVATRRHASDFPDATLDSVAAGQLAPEAAAAAVGCSRTELLRALRRTGRALPADHKTELTRSLLVQLYETEQLNCAQIALRTGWGVTYIRQALHRHGIKIRSGPRPGTPGRWHPRRS
jgi:AraC-like DNA-binding protein